jgi:hypothetical protein
MAPCRCWSIRSCSMPPSFCALSSSSCWKSNSNSFSYSNHRHRAAAASPPVVRRGSERWPAARGAGPLPCQPLAAHAADPFTGRRLPETPSSRQGSARPAGRESKPRRSSAAVQAAEQLLRTHRRHEEVAAEQYQLPQRGMGCAFFAERSPRQHAHPSLLHCRAGCGGEPCTRADKGSSLVRRAPKVAAADAVDPAERGAPCSPGCLQCMWLSEEGVFASLPEIAIDPRTALACPDGAGYVHPVAPSAISESPRDAQRPPSGLFRSGQLEGKKPTPNLALTLPEQFFSAGYGEASSGASPAPPRRVSKPAAATTHALLSDRCCAWLVWGWPPAGPLP